MSPIEQAICHYPFLSQDTLETQYRRQQIFKLHDACGLLPRVPEEHWTSPFAWPPGDYCSYWEASGAHFAMSEQIGLPNYVELGLCGFVFFVVPQRFSIYSPNASTVLLTLPKNQQLAGCILQRLNCITP